MGQGSSPRFPNLWLLHTCPCCPLLLALGWSTALSAPAARSLLLTEAAEHGLSAASSWHFPLPGGFSTQRGPISSLEFVLINTYCPLLTPGHPLVPGAGCAPGLGAFITLEAAEASGQLLPPPQMPWRC